MKTKHLQSVAAALCLAALGLAGCTRQAETSHAPTPALDEALPAIDIAALAPLLARADAEDGQSDHVVSKCITCMLHMEGKAEHAATLGDYTLHLCSDHCRETFSADPEKAVQHLARNAAASE